MKCRKCGIDIPEQSKFCLSCGAKQEITAKKKKRGNGQGTAIKRGKTWTAIWTEKIYIAENEKICQKRCWKGGFSSQTKALAYAANPPTAQEKVHRKTVRFYYKGWLASDYKNLSKNRQSAYRTAWDKLDTIADRLIGELSINDLQDAIDAKADTYYPARDMKTVLSKLYDRAVAEGEARVNLTSFIRLPELEETESKPFTQEELNKLWKAYADGNQFLGFILLMIYTGMMPGELFAAADHMIDWERHEIIGCGKKTKQRKEKPIVFPEFIVPILEQICTNTGKGGRLVKMNKWDFYEQYHTALKEIGIRDLPPYSCRHTTATALALNNNAPSVIQDVMRHAKFATTQRYIHPDRESAHQAINTLKGSPE